MLRINDLLSLGKRTPPPPGLCCVGFSADGIAISYITRINNRPQLHLCQFIPISDASPDAILYHIVKENRLQGAVCSLMLRSADYRLLSLETLPVAAEELAAAIRWRIKDQIDFPVEDAAVDCFQIPTTENKEKQNMVYVVAARISYLKTIAQSVRNAGLNLQYIDIPELALRNIAALLPEDKQQGVGILNIKPSGGELIITRQSSLYLARNIEVPQKPEAEQDEQLSQNMALEIQRSFDYYQNSYLNQSQQAAQVKLFVTPPYHTVIPHLARQLPENGVEALNLERAVSGEKKMDSVLQTRCLSVIGGALRV